MKKSLLVFLIFVLGLAFLFGGFQTSWAQEDEFTLEEIVVTAQKREQQVQDVPIAITITSAEQMERQLVYTLQDLSRTTPALEFGDTGSGPGGAAGIRGVGTISFNPNTEPSVGVVVDGVPQGSSNVGNLFDVQRVEVLRGPQGTLFGNAASAGIINIITASPELGIFKARVGLDVTLDDTLGSKYGRQEARAMINVPATEFSAFRATVNANLSQGLRKNVTKGQDDQDTKNYDFRAKYLYEPSEDFSVSIIGEYAKRDTTGPNLFAIRGIPSTDPAYSYLTGPDCGITNGEENQEVCSTFDFQDKLERYSLSAQFDWVMADHSFVSISSYKKSTTGPTNQNIFGYDWAPYMLEIRRWGAKNHTDTITQELRVHSPADRKYNYLAGVYYNNQEREPDALGSSQTMPPVPPPPIGPPPFLYPVLFPVTQSTTETIVENTNYAVFADGDYPITDALTVLGGLRYSVYDISIRNNNVETGEVVGSDLDKGYFTWRAGLQYAASENMMVYTTIARSVKSPIISPPAFTDPDGESSLIKAEIPTSVEVGTKLTAFGNRLALDFNVFHNTIEDYQGQRHEEDDDGVLIATDTNINEVVSKGLEIDIFGQPIAGLKINAGYMYNVVEYPSEYAALGIKGEQLQNAPLHKFTFSGEYGKVMTDSLFGFIAFDTTYKSEKRMNTGSHPSSIYGPNWVSGARIGVRQIDDKWSVTLFARNLFEDPEPVAVFTFREIVMGIPSETSFRQVGLSFNMNFN